MRSVKTTLVFLILLSWAISLLQTHFHIFRDKPLMGYYNKKLPPELRYFTWKRWFSSIFQDDFSSRLNDNIGLRNSLVRVRNQFDYSLFGLLHAEGFVEGKNGYLYEEDYIHEYTGLYFIGTRAIEKKLSRLKNVMDSLAFYDIPLILIFEPGKASFLPEYIPDRFHPEKRGETNYEWFSKQAKELGISCLDLNRYFLLMKDTSRYPLFPRNGMHWSLYGVQLAADTMSKFFAGFTGKPMPEFHVQGLRFSENSLGTDYDIGDLLNLVCPLKRSPGVYPMVSFRSIPDGSLPALVVADSYYVNLVESYGKKMFGKQDYWYYNSSVYPHQNDIPQVKIDKTNLREKLKSYGVILLMVSEINLHCCFWNFADEAFRAFHPEIRDSRLYDFENTIRIDRGWFRFLVKKSVEQKLTLEKMIRVNAEYMFLSNYQNIEGKGRQDSIEYLRLGIKNNPGWMTKITRKAKKHNIPVDSMILLDAIYSYDQSKKKQ